jgi:hypothetical protein
VGGYGFGEEAGVGVVFVEAAGMSMERYESGCGEDSGLTHASTEALRWMRAWNDGFAAADENGADGGAEALGETEHDGVEAAGEFGDRRG